MKIPVTVVTGFLGAGKTTLIRHLLANAAGRRLALIINEFGDLGVDREVLLGCAMDGCADDQVVELTNGCICCAVADEFLPAMETLLGRDSPPEHIVIETSGLALPKPLVQAFNWPEVRSRVTVDGVITVIDAPAVASGRFADAPAAVQAGLGALSERDHDQPLDELFEDQLVAADLVIVNKADLIDPISLAALQSRLRGQLRPGTKVVRSLHGRVAPQVVLGLGAAAEDDLSSRPSHHDGETDHEHDDFASFIADLGPVADPAALEARIRIAAERHNVLRIKGFVDVPGKPMRHVVQAVGPRVHRYYDRPWRNDERRESRLVVIGLTGLDARAIHETLAG